MLSSCNNLPHSIYCYVCKNFIIFDMGNYKLCPDEYAWLTNRGRPPKVLVKADFEDVKERILAKWQ